MISKQEATDIGQLINDLSAARIMVDSPRAEDIRFWMVNYNSAADTLMLKYGIKVIKYEGCSNS